MNKKAGRQLSRIYYQIGVMTLVTSILWVMLSIYQAVNKDIDVQVKKEMLTPLSAELDTEVLDELVSRRQMKVDVDNFR